MIYLDKPMKNDPFIDQLNKVQLIDKITALAFVLGILVGIVIASFLHKFIVHPLGW